MRTSPIIKLKQYLLCDPDYIKYEELFENEHIVDKKLLVTLFNGYKDLYYIFLKINIFLYRFDTSNLNNELKDYKHYKGKVYRIDDLDVILRHYYRYYKRCQCAIKILISDKLVPQNEIELLEKIINNPLEEQIRPTFDYEVFSNE